MTGEYAFPPAGNLPDLSKMTTDQASELLKGYIHWQRITEMYNVVFVPCKCILIQLFPHPSNLSFWVTVKSRPAKRQGTSKSSESVCSPKIRFSYSLNRSEPVANKSNTNDALEAGRGESDFIFTCAS
jgi:hypothetical protein